jgi:chromosome segregation ATPase
MKNNPDPVPDTKTPAQNSEIDFKVPYEFPDESYFIDEISKHEPLEWVNIPKPLQLVLISIKKCIIYHNKHISDISNRLNRVSNQANKKFDGLEGGLASLTNKIYENQEANQKFIKESNDETGKRLLQIKAALDKEFVNSQRKIEAKIGLFDEILGKVKKIVDAIPNSEEIDKRIKISNENMREQLKIEINDNYIRPELIILTNTINEIIEDTEKTKKNHQELIAKVLYSTKETKASIQSIQEELDNANIRQDIAKNDLKTLETQIEDHRNNLEALNKSFRELDHRFHLDFRNITGVVQDHKEKVKILTQESASIQAQIQEIKDKSEKIASDVMSNINRRKFAKKPPESLEIPLNPELNSDINALSDRKFLQTPQTPSDSTEIHTKLSKLEKYVTRHLEILEKKLNSELSNTIYPLEKKLQEKIQSNDSDVSEIKEKLSWLPMNISQLKGKAPTEARLYTLEARLRSEENSRIESINKLKGLIYSLTSSSTISDDLLPSVRTMSVIHGHTFSQDSGTLRKQAESEFSKKGIFPSVLSSSLDVNDKKSNKIKKYTRVS